MRSSTDIREAFLRYFEKNGHARVRSSSLVPVKDPTLFFTNAGMVQFKDVFTGVERRPYKRACSSQKCMRVSGKHNDLENVGHTPRHHTFFEMLGNFSFGDYFKKEAIHFGWEYLTKDMGLDPKRMYVTVFEDDDEAAKLWLSHVAKGRVFCLGEKDNFWAMADTGPCGPCSEILWDFASGPVKREDLESDRFMEIWNLVFMQFNRSADGRLEKLAAPSIDTGMGLERLAAVVQGVKSSWETDLFTPIIEVIRDVTGCSGNSKDEATALRVIADHSRCAAFLIADGVLPSNEGRGYVLRRILRRAVRYARKLNVAEPILHTVAGGVVDNMGDAYPELKQHRALVENAIMNEESRFLETIDRGIGILDDVFRELAAKKAATISGPVAFKLYDTYGFPKDLTELIAKEQGFHIDDAGFEKEMARQRERARLAHKGGSKTEIPRAIRKIYEKGVRTEFLRDTLECKGEKPLLLFVGDSEVDSVGEGQEFEFVVSETPFYAESGGQVGDTGWVYFDRGKAQVIDTQKPLPDLIIHRAKLIEGELTRKASLKLVVDEGRRQRIRCNHTATHLLHAALRKVLGDHVKQAGSLVDDERLRFDFSHFSQIAKKELEEVERLANDAIRKDIKVRPEELAYDDAIERGALAFFGEKYGDRVRVVQVGDVSMELCGGTHVEATGCIRLVKVTKERSVASGVRRIEALTGDAAEEYEIRQEQLKREAFENEKLKEQRKVSEERESSGRLKAAIDGLGDVVGLVEDIGGVKLISKEVFVGSVSELREVSDYVRDKIGSGVVVLGANIDGKASLVAAVTKDLTKRIRAGDIIRNIVPIVGGRGGGRPEFAQGGGTDTSKLDEALDKVKNLIT